MKTRKPAAQPRPPTKPRQVRTVRMTITIPYQLKADMVKYLSGVNWSQAAAQHFRSLVEQARGVPL